jgi:hypothetical protein
MTTTRGKGKSSATGTATQTGRTGTGGTGAGTGTGGIAVPLGIPSGGASVPTATTQSTVTGGVNWSNVQQQFPAIAWNQERLAGLMTAIDLGPQNYAHGEYQAMLTQFRNVCSQQIQLFQRLHLGEREPVNV